MLRAAHTDLRPMKIGNLIASIVIGLWGAGILVSSTLRDDDVGDGAYGTGQKVAIEGGLLGSGEALPAPTCLRFTTVYGAAPRMRFDLTVNEFTRDLWAGRRLEVFGEQFWRPYVHVSDAAVAIRTVLEAPERRVRGEVFNVGHNGDNYRIREIAEIVAEAFPGCEISFGPNGGDNRSYRVSFDKIHERVPAFKCEWTAKDGAHQLRRVFEKIEMGPETFDFRAFTRLKQLEYLQRTKQIDEQFFWRPEQPAKGSGGR